MALKNVIDSATDNFVELNGNKAFDPAIIDVIATIVIDLIVMFQELCGQSAADAVATVRNPSWLTKIRLRYRLRQQLGRRDFRTHGRNLEKALLAVGKNITVEQMQELYEEV